MENQITEAKITRAAELTANINANVRCIKESFIELGRDLKSIHDEKLYEVYGYDDFETYCDEKTRVKQRQAYNYIKVYEMYGENLEVVQNISFSNLLALTSLDKEDREELIENGDAEQLSSRELQQKINELQKKCEQLTLDLGEKSKEENKLDKMRNEMEKLQAELAAQKDIQAKKDERIKALESKPVEVAVAKPSKAEIAEIEKKAAKKAEAAAKKQHDKELAELREKAENERREAVKAAEREKAAEIERLKNENAALQLNAKKAPPSAQKERVKFYIEECLRGFNSALEALYALPEDERGKSKSAMTAMVEKMGELLKGAADDE